MSTVEQYLRDAFQAILRGDKAERDRLCNLAEKQMEADKANEARLRSIDPVDSLENN
jgi:hypothetical protein